MKKNTGYAILTLLITLLSVDSYLLWDKTRAIPVGLPLASESKTEPEAIIPPFVPSHISIPAISVDTTVDEVGKEKNGNMSVPSDWNRTGWYKLGAHPGEKGNAVIAGHYDGRLGLPAVFYDLRKLKSGDEIHLTDKDNRELTFVVTEVTSYKVTGAPLDRIFGASDEAHLNLITCDGPWNKKTRSYDQRLVVFSKLKPSSL